MAKTMGSKELAECAGKKDRKFYLPSAAVERG